MADLAPTTRQVRGANAPLSLMLFVLGVYLLTMSGHTYSPDEETMLEASRSLVTGGTWAITPSHALVEVVGAGGRSYSQYGPGQSFAATPWVAVGLVVGGAFSKNQAGYPLRLILGSYNALISAGICGLLAALGMLLGYGRRASLLLGGTLAFATFLWPHSRTFFSEPLTALLLLGSFYLLADDRRQRKLHTIEDDGRRDKRRNREGAKDAKDAQRLGRVHSSYCRLPTADCRLTIALSGVLFALALATKVQYVVALPAFLLYLLWPVEGGEGMRNEELGVRNDVGAASIPNSSFLIPNSSAVLSWGVGFVVGLIPLLLYNWGAFGNPLLTGYGADFKATFKTPLLEGGYGLLLSPGKGLLWFALPVAISVWGFRRFAVRYRAEAAFILALSISIVTLFALYAFWHGDGSWGPRYLIPLLPFALLPALPLLDGSGQKAVGRKETEPRRREGREGRAETPKVWFIPPTAHCPGPPSLLIATLIAISFVVNLLGVLVNFDTYINLGYSDDARHFDPAASPIVGHFRLLEQRLQPLGWGLIKPTGQVAFTGGFSYSEGDKTQGELLPRWTTGQGALQIWPDLSHGPVVVTLRLSDHRPPQLPRATLRLLLNGKPVIPRASPVPDMPITTDYTFTVGSRPSNVTIVSDTWNPSRVGAGERDEEIGLKLEGIIVREGGQARQYGMTDAVPPPPYYPQPRWYYDPATPHPADLWPVYMAETGMSRKAMLALALPLVAAAFACLLLGVRGLRRGA